MKIAGVDRPALGRTFDALQAKMHGCASLEQAAQACTDGLYTQFKESLVLARVYASVPFRSLPAPNKAFVEALLSSKGVPHLLKPETPVLSLLGTCGVEADWNDRRKSKGHVGIPLAGSVFVSAIPMIARLLDDIGAGLGWLDRPSQGIDVRKGLLAGVFYVEDAATSTDQQGRQIIPAQDFVKQHQVKTVFGIGAAYMEGTLLSVIAFTRDALPKATAEQFMPLGNVFKMATATCVKSGAIFAG
ncbi:MAG: hypothetical protein HY904_07465 [Deltaproteobacteria bacterium]|nr:hypothetical protein [Deltaproteobacteria bacterium]